MNAAGMLREYGAALRGDWADFDGRSGRAALDEIASWIEDPAAYPGDEDARRSLGICVTGGGHWCGPYYGYCNVLIACDCPDDPAEETP
jgi:hypothetical protein